jgi:hypothetical protein
MKFRLAGDSRGPEDDYGASVVMEFETDDRDRLLAHLQDFIVACGFCPPEGTELAFLDTALSQAALEAECFCPCCRE